MEYFQLFLYIIKIILYITFNNCISSDRNKTKDIDDLNTECSDNSVKLYCPDEKFIIYWTKFGGNKSEDVSCSLSRDDFEKKLCNDF